MNIRSNTPTDSARIAKLHIVHCLSAELLSAGERPAPGLRAPSFVPADLGSCDRLKPGNSPAWSQFDDVGARQISALQQLADAGMLTDRDLGRLERLKAKRDEASNPYGGVLESARRKPSANHHGYARLAPLTVTARNGQRTRVSEQWIEFDVKNNSWRDLTNPIIDRATSPVAFKDGSYHWRPWVDAVSRERWFALVEQIASQHIAVFAAEHSDRRHEQPATDGPVKRRARAGS